MTFTNNDDSFYISHTKRTQYFTMPDTHFHDTYEIYYLLSGERYYFIKDKTYHVKKGDLIFIDIYDLHRTIVADTPTHERIVIKFSDKF